MSKNNDTDSSKFPINFTSMTESEKNSVPQNWNNYSSLPSNNVKIAEISVAGIMNKDNID